MTEHLKTTVEHIRSLTYQSYEIGGRLLALLDDSGSGPAVERQLEKLLACLENAVIEARNLCERNRPDAPSRLGKPAPPDLSVAGRVSVNAYGWLHIELNTLLPHCRFQTPAYLTHTIIKLLDGYETDGHALPYFDRALLVIDEHCNIQSRQVYDADNRGWKAIPNAIKGRIVPDDDQFTLELALLSTVSAESACHIHILPRGEADVFFSERDE
jgi:hypothetical protein